MSGYGYTTTRLYISKEEILSKVSQKEIFQMIFGYLPEEYRYTSSPFRQDNHPNCYFEWYKGTLWFIDWAESGKRRHRDCFNAVQDHYGVTFYGSLGIVNKHFKLELSAGHHEDSEVTHTAKEEKELLKSNKKKVRDITFKARSFNGGLDKDFWTPFEITRNNLVEDNVFPVVWYRVFSKRLKVNVTIRPYTRTYLVGNFNPRVKIYTPDLVGKGKWITNCTENDIGGLDSLAASGELLVITKSYKDYRVLKNQGLNVVWFQNEGMIPKGEIFIDLLKRFTKVIVFFDNDDTGIKASIDIANIINSMFPHKATPLHLPTPLLDLSIYDPSDYIKTKGKSPLLHFLKENQIII